MRGELLSLIILLAFLQLLQSCANPEATVFEDKRLLQEPEIKFCFTGDVGTDTEYQRNMAEALARENCHRIFLTGDLVYPKGIKSADDPELLNKFLTYYDPLFQHNPDLVINLVLGNHDHGGDPSAWMDVAKKYHGYFFPNYYYLIDYGGLCVVALDTSFYYYEKKVAEAAEQTAWLLKIHQKLKGCDVKVAVTHHPFKGGDLSSEEDDWDGAKGELKAFLDGFVIGTFDIHMAGHVHNVGYDGKDEGTTMLISGAGGEMTMPGGRPGYVVLTWRPSESKRIGYRVQRVDMETTVIEEPAQQKQQPEPVEHPFKDGIPKGRVEKSWYSRLIDIF